MISTIFESLDSYSFVVSLCFLDFLTKEYVTPRKVRRLKLMLSAKKEASKVPRKIRPKLVDKEASILADTPSRRDDIREEPEPFLPFFWVLFGNSMFVFSERRWWNILATQHAVASTYKRISYDIIVYQLWLPNGAIAVFSYFFQPACIRRSRSDVSEWLCAIARGKFFVQCFQAQRCKEQRSTPTTQCLVGHEMIMICQ